MDICHSTDFDAPTEEVYGLLTHRDFQREKARRLDALAFDMDTQVDGPRTTVVTKRKVATAGLPEFVKSMLTPSMVVVETEVWDSPPAGNSPTGGAFTVDVDGAPVRLRGRVDLAPNGPGSRLTFTGQLTATVPLFRSRIEEASSGSIHTTMTVEAQLVTERLGAHTG